MSFQGEAASFSSDISKLWLQQKFPVEYTVDYTPEQWTRAEKIYPSWYVITVVLVLVYLLGGMVAFAWLLQFPYIWIYKFAVSANNQFFPVDWMTFIIPGFFLMLCTIGEFIEMVQRLFMNNDYKVFAYYYDVKQKYDNKRATQYIRKLMLTPLIIALLHTFSIHIITKENSFSYRSFSSLLPKTIEYLDIIQLQRVKTIESKKGEILPTDIYRIVMTNDTMTTGFYFNDQDVSESRFVNTLSALADKPIDTLGLLRWQDR